jgi:bacillithiol system protein YtxJ
MAMPAVNTVRNLSSPGDFQRLLEVSEERSVMILKHSTRCPVSRRAHGEFLRYAEGAAGRGIECAAVLVVESRELSGAIATALDILHESPQAILVRGRRAVWHDSHGGVTSRTLEAAEAGAGQ